ncbi:MAG: serine/threonine protein kinase [Deltaproteobacteria bacterium HGW-Deltaproteobacteria-20]|nr:MAG: serine/threonine protein kinase [Deltaproteobacteria bacterium HGW-Deltaproteobacteria-20]
MEPLQAGQLFAERYRVVRCVAFGGMGAVHEAVHIETERVVALKVLLPSLVDQPELRDRFRVEARITARIESDAIVQVFDAGVDLDTGMPYLVMELLRGETLFHRVERAGPLSPAVVCGFLAQLASALDKAHEAQIVHRDLKPENLFLARRADDTEQLKILDFGLAKIVQENAARNPATSSVGTPLYMAPEQFNTGVLSGATDIYALGMLAYTILVGEPYWCEEASRSGTLVAFAMVVSRGPVESPVERAARHGVHLPAAFDDWFRRVTSSNEADRPHRASEAVGQLAETMGVALPVAISGVLDLTRPASGTGAMSSRSCKSATSSAKTSLVASVGAMPVASRRVTRTRLVLAFAIVLGCALLAGFFLARRNEDGRAEEPIELAGPSLSASAAPAFLPVIPPVLGSSAGLLDAGVPPKDSASARTVPRAVPTSRPKPVASSAATSGQPLYTRE